MALSMETRIVRLEANQEYMAKEQERLTDEIIKLGAVIKELTSTIDRSKGAFWMLLGVGGGFGSLLSWLISHWRF